MNLAKTNLLLGGIAVALAVPTWLTLAGERELFVDVAAVPRMFEGFTPATVAVVGLGQPKAAPAQPMTAPDPAKKPGVEYDMVQIARTEKGWVLGQGMGDLTGAPVNGDLLEQQVWKHLTELRADKQSLVQPDATDEQLAEFGLDEAHAFVVKAINAQNQPLAELYVGKDTAAGQAGTEAVRGVYARRAGSRDVVLYEVPFWQRQIKPEIWIDRTLFKAPADKVRKLAIKNASTNGVAVEFTRPEGKGAWTASNAPDGTGALRQSEIENLAQRFAYVTAQEFKRPLAGAALKALGLEPPAIEITITWQDGEQSRTETLSVGNKPEGKNEYYLRTASGAFLMTWPQHFVAPFEKDLKELFDPKGPAPEPPKDPPKDGGKNGDKKDGNK